MEWPKAVGTGRFSFIPIRLNVDSPAPVMVRLDPAIALNMVLMQMVRSGLPLRRRGPNHDGAERAVRHSFGRSV